MTIKNIAGIHFSFCDSLGQITTIYEPSREIVANVDITEKVVDTIEGIPVISEVVNGINNIPDPEEGVIYLVTSKVGKYCTREDVYYPTSYVTDGMGRIIGYRNMKCCKDNNR